MHRHDPILANNKLKGCLKHQKLTMQQETKTNKNNKCTKEVKRRKLEDVRMDIKFE